MPSDTPTAAAATPNGGSTKTRVSRTLMGLCLVSLLATLLFGLSYWRARQQALTVARDRAHAEAVRAAGVIDTELGRLPLIVRGIAADLSSGRTGRDQLLDRLRTAMDTTPQLFGVGAAYVAYGHDPDIRLYAPYYRRTGETSELIDLDSLYDYTQGDRDWFQGPLKTGAAWSEPALTDASPVPVVEFSAPFTDGPSGHGIVGVIHGTMALSDVDDLIRSLDLGSYGYGFLVSKNGFVISHPFADEFTGDHSSGVTDVSGSSRAAARHMFDAVRTGRAGIIENAIDPVTGEPSWVFSEPVPSTEWTVGIVFFKQESAASGLFRRQQMRLTLAALMFGMCLMGIGIKRIDTSHIPTLWASVAVTCAVLILGIGVLWTEAYASPSLRKAGDTVFANTSGVRQFALSTTKTSLKRKGTLPFYVPTGIFVQTLDVSGPNNVVVTGYIWQRYAKNIPSTITRGFSLPDAADSTLKESYRRNNGDSETIGWSLKATIRQSFDYAKYPLDQQNFRLRIWHADLEKGVILVPDLDSYRIIHPLARPGIENDFTLPGWNVERTQFSNVTSTRNTSFGVSATNGETFNELSFNIVLDRKILEPVFSSLLPLTVVCFMVFSLLLLVKENTRSNVVQLMSGFSGLFFVSILSELDLRRRLSSSSISYIEFFYFVVYLALLTSALLNLSNAYAASFPRLVAREHLMSKLLFWPMILTVLLVLTVLVFY